MVLATVAVALLLPDDAKAETLPRRAITDLEVINGSSSGIQCPSGYTKNPQDLNEGAGGDHIYLCLQYNRDYPWAEGTWGLAYIDVDSYTPGSHVLRYSECPDKEGTTSDGIPGRQELLDVDLNKGAGGSYLYFCAKYLALPLEPSYSPGYRFIYDIGFVTSDSRLDGGPFSDPTARPKDDACKEQVHPNARSVSDTDLNQLAGGKYIYACEILTTDVSFKDDSPPEITPVVSGAKGAAGWYTSDVTVSWGVKDPQSEVTVEEGCDTTSLTSDTTGKTFTCTATSEGGTTSESVTVKRDATAPAITASHTPEPNAAGWNNTDVTVSFVCEDATSGVAGCSEGKTFTTEGAGQSVPGTAADEAGNTASVTVNNINIDKTSPEVTFEGERSYTIEQGVLVTCSANDALSGLADDPCDSPLVDQPAYELKAGENTVGVTATDIAGNVAKRTTTYTVHATYDSLKILGERFVSGPGEQGVEDALNNSLTQAEEFEDKGKDKQREEMFATYLNKVSAYEKGGQVSRAHAEILSRWATYMEQH